MDEARHESRVDFSEVRARTESIDAGVRLTLVLCAAGWLYVVATWDRPDRQLIASLFGLGAVVALLFVLIPHERVVRSRWREPFFLLWSFTQIALIAAVAWADGGATSPLALMFFVPVIFSALSYPLASVVAIGALDYIAYIAVGVGGDQHDPEYMGFFALCLGVTAALCGWHARNQEQRRDALSRVSRADPLTGCLNRRGFEERFDAELSSALRHGRPFGLISLDLDHFKEVNDTRGHAAGDELLRWAVDVMKETARPMDTVGRIGGDEFAVIAPGAGPDDSTTIARRLQTALATRAPSSVGVACFPTDGADRDELQRSADTKLYAGKRGRDTPVKMTAKELSWATALARAVDDRMAVQQEHSWKVAQYCVGIGDQLRVARARPRVAPDGRHPARRRQGFDSGPHPAQATAAHRVRLGGDSPEPGARRGDRLADPGARDDRAVDPALARALRRIRVPGRAQRRGDPAGMPHPACGRRLRRDHERPSLPRAAVTRGRAGRDGQERRLAVRPGMRGRAPALPRRGRGHGRAPRRRVLRLLPPPE